MSYDKTYIEWVTACDLEDPYGFLVLSPPYREGYTFAGFALTQEETELGMATHDLYAIINEAPGTILYAVWIEE